MSWAAIAALAGLVLVGAAELSRLGLQTWVKSLVEGNVKARFDKELEGFRSEVRLKEAEITALQSSVLSGRAGRQALLETRRIEAIENLWRSVIKLNAFQWSASVVMLLNFDEIDKHSPGEEANLRKFMEVIRGQDLDEKLSETMQDEEARLHVPEEIWKLYKAYKGLLVYCYMRLKSAGLGVTGKYFKDEEMVKEIKEVLPHFADYLSKWGVSGAAGLTAPLRDSILRSLKAALLSKDADVANAVATHEMVQLVAQMDQRATEAKASA